jgi:hypothetical protein
MPDLSMPSGWAIPETALWLFLGWPAYRVVGLRLSFTPLDTPRRMPMLRPYIKKSHRNFFLVLALAQKGVVSQERGRKGVVSQERGRSPLLSTKVHILVDLCDFMPYLTIQPSNHPTMSNCPCPIQARISWGVRRVTRQELSVSDTKD